MALSFGRIRTRLGVDYFQVFLLIFHFFPAKHVPCFKLSRRYNCHKAPYARVPQRDLGAGRTSSCNQGCREKEIFGITFRFQEKNCHHFKFIISLVLDEVDSNLISFPMT